MAARVRRRALTSAGACALGRWEMCAVQHDAAHAATAVRRRRQTVRCMTTSGRLPLFACTSFVYYRRAVYAFTVRLHACCCTRLLFAKFIFSSSAVYLPFIFYSSTVVVYYCGAPLMSSATLGRCSYCVRHRSFLVFLMSVLLCSVSSVCSMYPRTDCTLIHAVL